jgi:hypothetical protein
MYGQPGMPTAPASQTNGFALTSLITGILGCLLITPFIAIITGIIGFAKGAPPRSGRGMAIAGIVLGVLWLAGLGVTAGVSYAGYKWFKENIAQPAENTGRTFFADLEKGDFDAAKKYLAPEFSKEKFDRLAEQVRELGAFQSFSLSHIDSKQNGKTYTLNVSGDAYFKNGSKSFSAKFSGTPGDQIRIDDLDLR